MIDDRERARFALAGMVIGLVGGLAIGGLLMHVVLACSGS